MPVTKSRAKYPLSNEAQPQEPQFVRVVDSEGSDTAPVYNSALPANVDGLPAKLQVSANGRLLVSTAGAWGLGDGQGLGNTVGFQFNGSSPTGASLLVTAGYHYNGASFDYVRGDTNGQVVQPALSATFWRYAAAAGGIVSSVADVALNAAAGAGVRNFISSITINHDTLSAATECVIKDGATVIWRGKLQTAATDIANGAGTIRFNPPLRGTANTAMNFALLTSVTGGVFVNALGYTGA